MQPTRPRLRRLHQKLPSSKLSELVVQIIEIVSLLKRAAVEKLRAPSREPGMHAGAACDE
jgi:hypothetical protein